MKNIRIFSPDLGSDSVAGSKKYIPIMIVIGIMFFPALVLVGVIGNSIAEGRVANLVETMEPDVFEANEIVTYNTLWMSPENLAARVLLIVLLVAVIVFLALLELYFSRKFTRVSKAMRTAVVLDDEKITIMECANRQKGKFETFMGSIAFDAKNGIDNQDMLGIYSVRKGIEENNQSLSIAEKQVQSADYIRSRYSNRGEDFKYVEYQNPKLVEIKGDKLVFEGDKLTLQGTKTSKFILLNIYPELDKAI